MANPPTAGNAKKIGRGGRKRRIAGWTLLLLGLLVAAVWGASGWWVAGYSTNRATYGFGSGLLAVETPMMTPPGWWTERIGSEAPSIHWRAYTERTVPNNAAWDGLIVAHVSYTAQFMGVIDVWSFAAWPIPLLLWTPAALLLRSGILARRRAVKGMCAKCGYSLAGLAPTAACPECGKRA